MKILLTGANGQLGQELQRTKPTVMDLFAVTHQELDITQPDQVHAMVATLRPDCIINVSAYTAVDDAEKYQDLAFAVNVSGAEHLAQAAYIHNARMIYLSTDYVFDGSKNAGYLPQDLPNPLNYYGMSKWYGEKKVQETLAERSLIIRTSWVYSCYGKNFVKTMLEYLAEREKISMVVDQIGSPTWAKSLAQVIWNIVGKKSLSGIYHWSDDGAISKFDFLVAIQEEALNLQLIKKPITISPINSVDFPVPAKRPLHAILDKTKTYQDFQIQSLHWRVALRNMLTELKNSTLNVC